MNKIKKAILVGLVASITAVTGVFAAGCNEKGNSGFTGPSNPGPSTDTEYTTPENPGGEQEKEPDVNPSDGQEEKEPGGETNPGGNQGEVEKEPSEQGGEQEEQVFALAEIGEALKQKFELDKVVTLYKTHNSKTGADFLSCVGTRKEYEGGKYKTNYVTVVTKVDAQNLDSNSGKEDRDSAVNEIVNLDITNRNDCKIENVGTVYNKTTEYNDELVEGLFKKFNNNNCKIIFGTVEDLRDSGVDPDLNDTQSFFMRCVVLMNDKISVITYDVSCSKYADNGHNGGYDAVLNGNENEDYKFSISDNKELGNIVYGYQQSVEDYNEYNKQQASAKTISAPVEYYFETTNENEKLKDLN